MGMDTYVGARYVPRFLGTYDPTQIYEALDVVDNGSGTSYISKIPTPAGTPLTDTTHWALYGASSGAIAALTARVDALDNAFPPLEKISDVIRTPEAYGAVGDGVTDDTAAINAALADGGTIVFRSGATYMVDTDTALLPIDNSVLALNGAILKAIPNAEDHYEVIMVKNKKNVVIRDGIIIGDRDNHLAATGEWGMGVYCYGSDHIYIENMDITDTWGDGVYIGEDCHDIKVIGCRIDHCRRQGISVTQAEDVVITGNVITDIIGTAPECGVDIEPNANQAVKRVTVANNIIKDTTYGIVISGAASGATVEDIIENGNLIIIRTGSVHRALQVTHAARVKIVNNSIQANMSSSSSLLYLDRADDYLVSGNSFSDCAAYVGIRVSGGNGGTIKGNIFSRIVCASEFAYYLNTSYNEFSDNHLDNITTTGADDYLLYFAGSTSYPSNKNVVKGNTVIDSIFKYAFAFGADASYNTFFSNVVNVVCDYVAYTRVAGVSGNALYFNSLRDGTSGTASGLGGYGGSLVANIVGGSFVA